MDSALTSPVGERVYCHECELEWSRAHHGLECPDCHSDFTEVLEEGNDPRNVPLSATSTSASASAFNEPRTAAAMTDDGDPDWEDAPDPDEDDIADVNTLQGRLRPAPLLHDPGVALTYFLRATDRGRPQSRPAQAQPHDQEQTPDTPNVMPMARDFQTMLQGMLGGAMASMHSPAQTPTPTTANDDLTPTRSRSLPRFAFGGSGSTTVRMGGTPDFQWRVTTTTTGPANFYPENDTTTPTDAPQGITPTSPLPAILNFIFRGPPGHTPTGDPFGPLGPFAWFAGLGGDPASMAHGDAVYSQEALDRIITQLMEQHTSGSAPGPASEEAISSLPTREILSTDLGPEGTADCSICMDQVSLGDTVTVLPCNHWFHGDCVKSWLVEHDTCPHCRRGIMPKPSGLAEDNPDRLRSPLEEPRHDHSLGSPLPNSGPGSGPAPAGQGHWNAPTSPLDRRGSQSAGPATTGSGEGLFRRMRSAFGAVPGSGGPVVGRSPDPAAAASAATSAAGQESGRDKTVESQGPGEVDVD